LRLLKLAQVNSYAPTPSRFDGTNHPSKREGAPDFWDLLAGRRHYVWAESSILLHMNLMEAATGRYSGLKCE